MNSEQAMEMADKEYRHGLVNAQIEVDLPFQIRALRKQLKLTQPELAQEAGMKQPRISAMEKPGGAHFTLETLRRLAKAFDVALIVRFAPFSELLDWSERFSPDEFRVPTFQEELDGGILGEHEEDLAVNLMVEREAFTFRRLPMTEVLPTMANIATQHAALPTYRMREPKGEAHLALEVKVQGQPQVLSEKTMRKMPQAQTNDPIATVGRK